MNKRLKAKKRRFDRRKSKDEFSYCISPWQVKINNKWIGYDVSSKNKIDDIFHDYLGNSKDSKYNGKISTVDEDEYYYRTNDTLQLLNDYSKCISNEKYNTLSNEDDSETELYLELLTSLCEEGHSTDEIDEIQYILKEEIDSRNINGWLLIAHLDGEFLYGEYFKNKPTDDDMNTEDLEYIVREI